MLRSVYILTLFLLCHNCFADSWKDKFISQLKNGGALVESEDGKVVLSHRADHHFIPASVLKIATSFCALEELGRDYRFTTEFYTDGSETLYIRGKGDPNLISEEIAPIAEKLRKLLPRISHIAIDDSAFADDILVNGAAGSNNPYDAKNGALVVNFNTIAISKSGSRITRGEAQTPITPLASEIGKKLDSGLHRVNIGSDSKQSQRYAAELFGAFYTAAGGIYSGEYSSRRVPKSARLLFSHSSNQNLEQIVKGLLKFSTNFSANQIFLTLGAVKYGYPANMPNGAKAMRSCLASKLDWEDFEIVEGAGLSRKNQVTARQILILLRAFEKYRSLLPIESAFQAKTGTLTGVNSYAGYFNHPTNGSTRFVFLINSSVPANYKFSLASSLYRSYTGLTAPTF